mgnify:CR=1 FL=1
MLYYLGETFDKEKNKSYKTLDGGQKAAEREGLNLYDEDGNLVHEGKKPEADAQKPAEAHKGNQVENSAPETEKGQEGASGEATGASEEDVKLEGVTLTDDVPEDALTPNADGSVNLYDEDGQKAGTISEEEAKELEEKAGEQLPGVTPVRGKIRRIFDGLLRIRKRPSWDESACIGVTKFVEKDVVALHLVDGKPMYETLDGYFITGSKTLVEFIAG